MSSDKPDALGDLRSIQQTDRSAREPQTILVGMNGDSMADIIAARNAAAASRESCILSVRVPKSRENVGTVGMVGDLAADLMIVSRVMERNRGANQTSNNLRNEVCRAAFMCKTAQQTTVHQDAKYVLNEGAEKERLIKELVHDFAALHDERVERENGALETFDNEDSDKQ